MDRHDACCPIVELRQYTLLPGRRDTLVELFDRELVAGQEADGMHVIGQFRDLDDPVRFVWLRGFATMEGRRKALEAFYGGPVWKAHREAANATMVDSDDVLLLRPAGPAHAGFPAGAGGLLTASVCLTAGEAELDALAARFDREIAPALAAAGAPPLAVLRTLHADNTFPALPVRAGEHAFVWMCRFADPDRARAADELVGDVVSQRLRLDPTPGSRLR
jgi:hypothetical protein